MCASRLPGLIHDAISRLSLDLRNLVVLTEAASGPYVVTPVIAALAGAKRVIAFAADSSYATAEHVIAQTRALEKLCGIEGKTEIHIGRRLDLFGEADIVTNLGFVRPIDAAAVVAMKPTAVIPLMCEAWEQRPGDVDVTACRQKGITVAGTNEDHPTVDVFEYSGFLALKMLFDAQIEIHKSRILVVSSDKFGRVIETRLKSVGASVWLIPSLSRQAGVQFSRLDAVMIADYTRQDYIIGPGGDISVAEAVSLFRSATIMQFAGRNDAEELASAGMNVYPAAELSPYRMAFTLALLGPRPVIDLHAAGLRVGQVLHGNWRGQGNNKPGYNDCGLAQKLP